MAPQRSFKVAKTKKAFCKKPKLATIFEEVLSSYLCDPVIPHPTSKFSFDELTFVLFSRLDTSTLHQQSSPNVTFEGERVPSPYGYDPAIPHPALNCEHCGANLDFIPRTAPNNFFHHNGIYYTLEECQLICSLQVLGADDDLVSEIIKHERGSREPVNCAGLDQHLLDPSFVTTKDQVIHPILADIEAARVKAQNAYHKWMSYMTGIVWGLSSLSLLFYYSQRLTLVHQVSDTLPASRAPEHGSLSFSLDKFGTHQTTIHETTIWRGRRHQVFLE